MATRDRREFLADSARASISALGAFHPDMLARLEEILASVPRETPATTAEDETFWRRLRRAFVLEPGLIDLHNGLTPSPREVHDTLKRELDRVNGAPVLQMPWPTEGRREEVRVRAAALMGCDPEELAITRSATEALQIAQLGIDLHPGDEVVSTNEDYWAMWNTWQQRVRRQGIVYREVRLDAPYPPPEEIVARFERAITPRTRVILFCHMTWITGHILPVREICSLARTRGIRTIVDGAHSIGHVPLRVGELGCDYYGASGHKWLGAPLGTGFLYVRRERIRDLWPLTPAFEKAQEDIRKFEWVGGRSPAQHNGILVALRFLERMGIERKAARLHYLKRRWAERLARQPGVRILTDLDPARSCGLGSFLIDGIVSKNLAAYLLRRHRISVFGFDAEDYDGFPGVRVAANVFTATAEVDAFADAVETVLRRGLPTA